MCRKWGVSRLERQGASLFTATGRSEGSSKFPKTDMCRKWGAFASKISEVPGRYSYSWLPIPPCTCQKWGIGNCTWWRYQVKPYDSYQERSLQNPGFRSCICKSPVSQTGCPKSPVSNFWVAKARFRSPLRSSFKFISKARFHNETGLLIMKTGLSE